MSQTSQRLCPTHNFLDYFTQKEGNTFISQLGQIQGQYAELCAQVLAKSNQEVRNDYDAFELRFLDKDKISPNFDCISDFDFAAELAVVFSRLSIDVTDTLDMIRKYYQFISSLNNHWKGLDVEATTVIDISVQLMGTLESMVYPLFLRLTQFIGQLAEDGGDAYTNPATSPESMMNRLHKMVEALTMEISTIGASGVMTLGQSCDATQGNFEEYSSRLGCQGRNAKNCVSWAMQAVAPVLLYYYLRGIPDAGQLEMAIGATNTDCTECGAVASASQLNDCTSMIADAERRIIQRIAEGESNLRKILEACCGKMGGDAASSAGSEVSKSRESSRRREPEPKREESQTSRQERPMPRQEESRRKPEPLQGKEVGSVVSADNGDVIKLPEDLQNKDFVEYFFKKNGLKYIAILSETKKKYESRCRDIMQETSATERQKAKEYMKEVHDIRRVSPVTKEIQVGDFDFAEDFSAGLAGLEIDVSEKLALLIKYCDYIRGMIRHWLYRIQKNKALEAATIIDGCIQMMATTMALTYPVFIRIGEFIQKLARNSKNSQNTYSHSRLTKQLHKLVEINAIEMAAIGISCLNVIAKLPNLTKDDLREHRNRIAQQTKVAKNSISWAMKAISPLLFLYYLRCEVTGAGTQENEGPEQRKKRPREEGPKDAERERSGDRGKDRVNRERQAERRSQEPTAAKEQRERERQNSGDKQNMVYKKPQEQKNYVFYFYQKQGQHFSTVLSQMRKEYETKMQNALNEAHPKVKAATTPFIQKIHSARRPSQPKEDVEVKDVNFQDTVQKIFYRLDVDIEEDIVALCKYHEFTKNMISHWHFRIKNGKELHQDAVIEVSIQMMATTVAVAYPIFIKIAEYMTKLAERPKTAVQGVTPGTIIERLQKFVAILTIQMAAIGMSCLNTMMKLPGANKDDMSQRSTRLASETKYANNSVSWAMKAIFPILLLYFIQHEQAAYT